MIAQLGETLHSLCTRQRNRIWLRRVLRRSTPWFAYSALILVAAGLAHQLLLPLDLPLVLAFAFTPTLLSSCLLAISEKPTMQEAAADADRLFGANSLLVSAWELSRSQSGMPRTGKLLLRRCEAALPAWSNSSGPAASANLGPAGMLVVTLAAVGTFLLIQPSPVETRQLANTEANFSLVPDEESGRDAAQMLSSLLEVDPSRQTPGRGQSGAAPSRSTTTANAAQRGESSEPRVAITQKAATVPAANGPQSSPSTEASGAHMKSRTASAGERPRSTKREAGSESAAASGSSPMRPGDYERIQLVDIELGSGSDAGARDGSSPGKRLLESVPGSSGSITAHGDSVGELGASGFTYLLSPQQRSLVWRYLQRLENTDVPTK